MSNQQVSFLNQTQAICGVQNYKKKKLEVKLRMANVIMQIIHA